MITRLAPHKRDARTQHLYGKHACKLCGSTKKVTHGMWRGKNVPLCKECQESAGVVTQKMKDYAHDEYMKNVYTERAKKERKIARQQQVIKARTEQMEKQFFGGQTREQVEAEMPKGSRGKFGTVGTGKALKKSTTVQKQLW